MSEIIYHIVYTKRTKKSVIYKHNAAITASLDYDSIVFNDEYKVIGVLDRRVKLKWYKNTDYICWNYSQRIHIFVRDVQKTIEMFNDKNLKNYKSKLS